MAETERQWRFGYLAQGAAIVISILLAFGIEAGWDELQERREEQEVLLGLRSDFLANRSQLAEVIGTHRERATMYRRFRDASADGIGRISADSAGRLFGGLWAPHSFDVARSSIDALIGAGKLGIISDRALSNQLTAFLNAVEDLSEESRRMQSSSEAVLAGTVPHGGPWRNPDGPHAEASDLHDVSPSDISSLRSDADLVGRITLAHHYSATYRQELEGVARTVEELLTQIEARIR